MKLVCAILSILVVILAYTPVCNDDTCQLAEQSHSCENDDSRDNSGHDICSPFFTCGSCSAFFQSITVADVTPALHFINMDKPIVNNISTSSYHSDFWQPPKAC